MLKKRFENNDGKVVYITVEEVSKACPEGTLKVEVNTYPVGSGCYSSFIYTEDSYAKIESVLEKIGDQFLAEKLYGSREISDALSEYLNPIFPLRNET